MSRARQRLTVEECESLWVRGPEDIITSTPLWLERTDNGFCMVEVGCRQEIRLENLPAPGGGHRTHCVCPSCHRLCKALYAPTGRRPWACRVCFGLTYQSRQGYDERVNAILKSKSPDELLNMYPSDFPSEHVMWRALLESGAIFLA